MGFGEKSLIYLSFSHQIANTMYIKISLGILILVFITSCTKDINIKHAPAIYAINRSDEIVIYTTNQTYPIVLEKPIYVSELEKLGLPQNFEKDIESKLGIQRYVNGQINDVYSLSNFGIFCCMSTILGFLVVVCLFFWWVYIRLHSK